MSLPDSWGNVNLLDVCQINPRQLDKINISPETLVSVPKYVGGDVLDNQKLRYEKVHFGQAQGVFFKSDDILVGTRGPSAMVSQLVEHLPTDLGVAQHYLVLRPQPKFLRSEYLLNFIQQPWFQLAARKSNRGTQSQLTIPTQFFRDIRVPLPPVEEQDALILMFKNASLAPYHTAFADARRLRDLLAQELLLSGNQSTTYETILLSQACTLISHKAQPTETPPSFLVNYYSQAKVDWLTHQIQAERIHSETLEASSLEVQPQDVLFNLGHDNHARSTACIIPSEDDARHFASAAFQPLRPTAAILPEYLAWFLRLPWLRDQVRDSNKSLRQLRLSNGLLNRIRIPLPPLGRQLEIVKLIDNVPTKQIHRAVETATLLIQALYKDGFSGKLSSAWREANLEISALPASLQPQPTAEEDSSQTRPPELSTVEQELYTPAMRESRIKVSKQLSSFQMFVWNLICNKRRPLLIDDPEELAAACLVLQKQLETGAVVTPTTLRDSLQQLAALGLIRHMSIPGAQGTFVTAFRRFRVTENGRVAEDTAVRDTQLLRNKISEFTES